MRIFCDNEVAALADKIGEFIKYWGFKKVHGQVWCYLFLSPQPLESSFFIERLGISKALISQVLTDLEEYQVIFKIGKVDKKTFLYSANPECTEAIIGVLKGREQIILEEIMGRFAALEKMESYQLQDCGIGQDRLKKLGSMVKFAQRSLALMIAFGSVDFGDFKKII